MTKPFSFCLLSFICFFSCTNKAYLKKINSYLNASSTESKSKYMAEDYHSFFQQKQGDGEDKNTSLKSFQDWDGPMNPDVKILSHTNNGRSWLVKFNEQNDFSKLIGFPGWKGSMSTMLDNKGLIRETIYFPDSTNPSYRKWLQPALDWLEKNMPDELSAVYHDKKLIKTEASATKWKTLLNNWKSQKK